MYVETINSALSGELVLIMEVERDGAYTIASRRTLVAIAALLEVGREDLARSVRQGRRGDPMLKGEEPIIAKAFRLGHLADPDGAPVLCPLEDEVTEEHLKRGYMSKCDGCLANCA